MPRALGRDRLEPTTDGTVVLLSLRPKPWKGREVVSPRAPAVPGTAVRWDGELFEALSVEPRSSGGWRHVLAHWDDRYLVRELVEYGDVNEGPRGEAKAPIPAEVAAPPSPDLRPAPRDQVVSPPTPPAVAGTSTDVAPASSPSTGPAASGPSVARRSALPAPGARGGVAAAWRALSPAVRALVIAFVPSSSSAGFFPFRVMGEGISFLVHELGHTLVAWFFGCSAMPAIVMTIVFAQNRAVAAIVWGTLAFLAVKYRRAPGWNAGFAALAVLYPFVAFTQAHVTAFDLGGHLAEVAFAAWAFRRAVRGERPEWEQLVWAFFAFYLVARNVVLFGGVVLSAAARTDYLTVAITGQNDMVKVAATTGLELTTIAARRRPRFSSCRSGRSRSPFAPRRTTRADARPPEWKIKT